MTGGMPLLHVCLHEVYWNNSVFNVYVPLTLPIIANQRDNFTPAVIRLSVEWLII